MATIPVKTAFSTLAHFTFKCDGFPAGSCQKNVPRRDQLCATCSVAQLNAENELEKHGGGRGPLHRGRR